MDAVHAFEFIEEVCAQLSLASIHGLSTLLETSIWSTYATDLEDSSTAIRIFMKKGKRQDISRCRYCIVKEPADNNNHAAYDLISLQDLQASFWNRPNFVRFDGFTLADNRREFPGRRLFESADLHTFLHDLEPIINGTRASHRKRLYSTYDTMLGDEFLFNFFAKMIEFNIKFEDIDINHLMPDGNCYLQFLEHQLLDAQLTHLMIDGFYFDSKDSDRLLHALCLREHIVEFHANMVVSVGFIEKIVDSWKRLLREKCFHLKFKGNDTEINAFMTLIRTLTWSAKNEVDASLKIQLEIGQEDSRFTSRPLNLKMKKTL